MKPPNKTTSPPPLRATTCEVIPSEADGTRTRNHRIDSPTVIDSSTHAKSIEGNTFQQPVERAELGSAARRAEPQSSDPDLTAVINAWPTIYKETKRVLIRVVKADQLAEDEGP